jgi:hypothetical protein
VTIKSTSFVFKTAESTHSAAVDAVMDKHRPEMLRIIARAEDVTSRYEDLVAKIIDPELRKSARS